MKSLRDKNKLFLLKISLVLSVLGITSYAFSQIAFTSVVTRVFEYGKWYTSFVGDGVNGALTIPTGAWSAGTYNGRVDRPLSVNTTRSYLTANATAGLNTLKIRNDYTSTMFDAASHTGFSSCTGACSASTDFQEILIIQMGGSNAGTYEFAQIQTRSGEDITLKSNLENSYTH